MALSIYTKVGGTWVYCLEWIWFRQNLFSPWFFILELWSSYKLRIRPIIFEGNEGKYFLHFHFTGIHSTEMPLPHTKPEVHPLSLCLHSLSALPVHLAWFLCFFASHLQVLYHKFLVLWRQSSHAAQGHSYVCYIDLLSTLPLPILISSLLLTPSVFCPWASFKAYSICSLLSFSLVRVFWELLYTVFVQSCTRGSRPQVVILPPSSSCTVRNGNLCAWDSTCSSAGV